MPDTIFYAWQSDLPSDRNKNFIRSAIDQAITIVNTELGVEDAVRGDQDTQGVVGDINVAEVIFSKIDACRIFVADITTVTSENATRPSPNPNVLVEYGRASIRPGKDFVIQVFNEAFGEWETERPFDLRHRRGPVLYNLQANPTPETKRSERNRLARELASIFVEMLSLPPEINAPVDVSEWAKFREIFQNTLFHRRKTGRIIGFWCGLVPTRAVSGIETIWQDSSLTDRYKGFTFSLGNDPIRFGTIDSEIRDRGHRQNQPVRRGARSVITYQYPSGDHSRQYEEVVAAYVFEDGRIALIVRSDNLEPVPHLNQRWIIAEIANCLQILEKVRTMAGAVTTHYEMLIEIRYDDQSFEGLQPVSRGEWRLADIADETGSLGPLVSSEPLTIGPISVGPASSVSAILSDAYVQLVTSANREPESDLDFDSSAPPD